MRTKAKVNLCVYLILTKGDEVLLSLRQNTGYEDGKWSLVAGHAETNESAVHALCREVLEEIGIHIEPADLEVLHVMHRKSDRENIDIFMKCHSWKGEIINCEPEKCGGLKFFPKGSLPKEMVGYVQRALENIEQQKLYDEVGW